MRSVPFVKYVPILLLLSMLWLGFKGIPNHHNINKPAAAFNLITEKQFNALFPQRNKFYTYAAYMQAINDMANLQVKVTRRSTYIYQYIRTDKTTGKSTMVRQDADWNEAWAKTKPDSVYIINYANFCTESNTQTNKKDLAAFFAHIAHETRE